MKAKGAGSTGAAAWPAQLQADHVQLQLSVARCTFDLFLV
jgi:hypothetical protein